MDTAQWKPFQHVPPTRLREARLQSHYAVQWLARTARACIPPHPDDGHTNLGWGDAFEGFTTHPIATGKQLGLRLPDLTIAVIDHGKITQPFSLQERTEAEVRDWFGQQSHALNLPADKLDAALPYALDDHALAKNGRYDPAALTEPLHELADWYANGLCSLQAVRSTLLARGLSAPDIHCWPHHFDLDCLTVIGNGVPYVAPTMGAGFCPGDHHYDEPYFYISLYPRPEPLNLPTLPAIGHWHTKDFLAALVPASRILAAKEPQAETEAYLHAAADGILKLMDGGQRVRG